MFNSAAKLQFSLAAAALVLAVVYGFAISDPTGFTLLLGLFLAFTLGALAVTGAGVSDRAPVYRSLEDAPPLQTIMIDRSTLTPPSPWPLVAAVAMGILAVGVAVDETVVIVGIIACLIAAGGWLGQSWREDPTYTPRAGQRISQRLLAPFGLPILALGLIGVIVISISRVLLAVPKEASVAIAFGTAVVVLSTFFFLSARPDMGRNAFIVLGSVALVAVVVAGAIGANSGFRHFKNESTSPTLQSEIAHNTQFSNKEMTVTAGELARISFNNLDVGVYHNIAVYTSRAGGTPIWTGEPIKGKRNVLYQTVFEEPGTYTFRCDFHPTVMIGTFNVVKP